MAPGVVERRREFGVRLALGADALDIVRLVVRESVALTGTGLLIGLVGAAGGAWWLRGQLYGVPPWDPVTLAITAGVLAGVAATACAMPTRAAVRTDPAVTLRAD